MGVILEGRKISKWYQMGEVRTDVLKEVSFQIWEGEFLVILGPSGSGKSTLLNLIGGMDTVSAGELYYQGKPLQGASEETLTQYRRETVGFVFQFYNLIPNLTALENVKVSVEIAKNPLVAEEVLVQVGLSDRADYFPAQMSGGQQQRVSMARAIAKNPQILLCDEPTGSLDFETGIQVLKLLKKFNQEQGKTVILITHNAGIAEMADRVFYMKDGRISQIREIDDPLPVEEVSW